MIDAAAEALARRILVVFPASMPRTRADVARVPVPVGRLLGAELDTRADRFAALPATPWLDTAAEPLAAARAPWRQAVRAAARFPADAWEDAVAHAARLAVAHLVQPAETAAADAFADAAGMERLPVGAALARVRVFGAYGYLPEIAARYAERKGVAETDRAGLERLLRRIDRRMVEDFGPDEWVALTGPLFELLGPVVTPQGTLGVGLLRKLFEAKGRHEIAQTLVADTYTRDALRSHLAAVLPAPAPPPPRPPEPAPSVPAPSVPDVPPTAADAPAAESPPFTPELPHAPELEDGALDASPEVSDPALPDTRPPDEATDEPAEPDERTPPDATDEPAPAADPTPPAALDTADPLPVEAFADEEAAVEPSPLPEASAPELVPDGGHAEEVHTDGGHDDEVHTEGVSAEPPPPEPPAEPTGEADPESAPTDPHATPEPHAAPEPDATPEPRAAARSPFAPAETTPLHPVGDLDGPADDAPASAEAVPDEATPTPADTDTSDADEAEPLWKRMLRGGDDAPLATVDDPDADEAEDAGEAAPEPLWRRFAPPDRAPAALDDEDGWAVEPTLADAPEVPLAPLPPPRTVADAFAAPDDLAARQPAPALPATGATSAPADGPAAPAADTLEALEHAVLGPGADERRDWFVGALFGGSDADYRATLTRLAEAGTWTEATQIIASDVFRRHRVNIYSEPAVAFTDAVEARIDER